MGNETLDFIFLWTLEIHTRPHLILPVLFFGRQQFVDNSRLIISTCWLLKATCSALDVQGRWEVQRFHYTNTKEFSCSLWKAKSVKRLPVTPGASFSTVGNWEEHHIQPIGNKECQQRYCETILIGQRVLENEKWE